MYRIAFAFLVRLPAETAHHLALLLLRALQAVPPLCGVVARLCCLSDPALETAALGLRFRSPLGLAAGFDKDGVACGALAALGFGVVEVGTVTARAQPGNPRPRLFRLPQDGALVNRMGFNNLGAVALARRLSRGRPGVVGVNIGKSKAAPEAEAIADYVESARLLAPLAGYLVVNVSSPNTPGLRDLQRTAVLRPLLLAVREAADRAANRHVPLLVKIAPDLADEEVDAVADLALEIGLDGIIATNTTIGREGLKSPPELVAAAGKGGLSGAPLKARSLAVLRRLRARTGGRLVLVASGGIGSAADAWERIRAGATLVQVYTAFIYQGPLFARRVARGLAQLARQGGFPSVQAAVGSERG